MQQLASFGNVMESFGHRIGGIMENALAERARDKTMIGLLSENNDLQKRTIEQLLQENASLK
jgi:hypothetical protein